MNKKEIEEKLLREYDADYIQEINYNGKKYVKALKNQEDGIIYLYYEITEKSIIEIHNEKLLEYFREFHECKSEDIIY